jgi:cell division protease FtsH
MSENKTVDNKDNKESKLNKKVKDLADKIESEKKKIEDMAGIKNPGSKEGKPVGKQADVRRLKKGKKKFSFVEFGIGLTVILMMFLGYSMFVEAQLRGPEVDYSQIFNDLKEEKYEDPKLVLQEGLLVLSGDVAKEDDVETIESQHAVVNVGYSKADINSDLEAYEVAVSSVDVSIEAGSNADLIINILWLVLFAVGIFLIYNMLKGMNASGGKLMDFGQSKARLLFGKKTGISFKDVAGIDEVKQELVEVVDFLRNPKKYFAIGARIPKGVLLVGAPGTGKTLLAKAVAGEAGVPFFHTSGSEFEEMLVGAGASRVRDLFTKAKRAAPCIIFIDEIDAVAKKRGTVLHSGAGEQTLNQILVEMDGLENRENVIVLAATNRPDVLDPAILRPGRFDRSVTVHMPDYQGRKEIIAVHAKGKKFGKDVDFDVIAKKTIGYSGADLENLLNEAAIMAVVKKRDEIMQEDLMDSYLKVLLGREQKKKITEKDLKITAYHEAGHAVVGKILPDAQSVEKVSIISRGMTGGVTVFTPEDDSTHLMKKQMLAHLAVGVGGRIAEEIFVGDIGTGASGDIKSATQTAKAMVQNYGMSDELGFIKYGNMEAVSNLGYQYGGERDYSDKTAQLIDDEIRRLTDEAMDKAREILTANKEIVEKIVEILLDKEEVDKEEFDKLFK